MASNNTPKRPSAKQLSYLRLLVDRTGQSFTYPKTSWQARREIGRLLGAENLTAVERQLDREAIYEADRYGARVHDDEVGGFGSSARWAR